MSEKKLMSLADLFGDETEQGNGSKNVCDIEIEKLRAFGNHPFKLYEGQRLKDMVQSVQDFGVIVPIVVQPMEGDLFQILSGHNRVNAAEKAGLLTVPAVIKEGLTEEEATLIVTETNLMQRSFGDLSHSERAAVIATRHQAMANQGVRSDLFHEIERLSTAQEIMEEDTFSPVGKKLRTHEVIGEAYQLSRNSIARYLRIAKLTEALKVFVDSEEIAIRAGVDLSYMELEQQNLLAKCLSVNAYKVDMKKAKALRLANEEQALTYEGMVQILEGVRSQKEAETKMKAIKIKPKIIHKYFSEQTESSEIEQVIEQALALYFETQGREVLNE